MAKEKKNRYVVKLPLIVNDYAAKVLRKRRAAAQNFYNAMQGECLKRMHKYCDHPAKQQADVVFKISKSLEAEAEKLGEAKEKKAAQQKRRESALRLEESRQLYHQAVLDSGLYFRSATQYKMEDSVDRFSRNLRNGCWIKSHLDSRTTAALAERAFTAVEKMTRGTGRKTKDGFNEKSKRVRFKRKRDLMTWCGTDATKGIRWAGDKIIWNVDQGKKLTLPVILNENDPVVRYFLHSEPTIKTISIVPKKINGQVVYWAHLIVDGFPLIKTKQSLGEGLVCVDLGPNKIAVFCKETQFVLRLDRLDSYDKEITKLQRRISHSQRLNNPNNFEPDFKDKHGNWKKGKVKKGAKKWIVTKSQQARYNRLADLCRKRAEQRRCFHGKIANLLRSLGDHVRIEDDDVKEWQMNKRLSRMIRDYAPATLALLVKQKFASTGGVFEKIDTYKTHLSQTCPSCLRRAKKDLRERVHDCECGFKADRDIVSAFLMSCCENNVLDVRKLKKLFKVYGTNLRATFSVNESAIEILSQPEKVRADCPRIASEVFDEAP